MGESSGPAGGREVVAVCGAGAAGMAAALAAAEGGAEVVLVDEGAKLGGALNYARFDPAGTVFTIVTAGVDRTAPIRRRTTRSCAGMAG